MKTLHIRISGMHCEGCVSAVTAALSGRDGVASQEVRLGEAEVSFDPAVCGVADVVATVRDAGDFQIVGFSTDGE